MYCSPYDFEPPELDLVTVSEVIDCPVHHLYAPHTCPCGDAEVVVMDEVEVEAPYAEPDYEAMWEAIMESREERAINRLIAQDLWYPY